MQKDVIYDLHNAVQILFMTSKHINNQRIKIPFHIHEKVQSFKQCNERWSYQYCSQMSLRIVIYFIWGHRSSTASCNLSAKDFFEIPKLYTYHAIMNIYYTFQGLLMRFLLYLGCIYNWSINVGIVAINAKSYRNHVDLKCILAKFDLSEVSYSSTISLL